VDPARVRAAAGASGINHSPDTRSPEEAAWDSAFGKPDSADAYKVNYWNRSTGVGADELAKFDTDMRDWLHSLAVPVELGNHIAETLMSSGQALGRMSAAERDEWEATQDAIVERIAGSKEEADAFHKLAAGVIARGIKGEVSVGVHRFGALKDANIVVQLARHAQRVAARGQ
jgi:hypothetical protein